MKARCIKSKDAHWGSILTIGKWYDIQDKVRKSDITLITDNDNYFKYTGMISSSISWVRKGYTQETLKEVIPGYLTMKERDDRYTIGIEITFFCLTTDDGHTAAYCILSKKELLDKYGSCKFSTTVYFFEDYFETLEEVRDKKLNEIIS